MAVLPARQHVHTRHRAPPHAAPLNVNRPVAPRVARQRVAPRCSSSSTTPRSPATTFSVSELLDAEYQQSSRYKSGTKLSNGAGHAATKPTLKISWAGAGIYFFWQLGAVKYLQERYDLTQVEMAGASGGALAAVLGGCGVNADVVLESAYQLSMEHGVWERPLGLLGVWGRIIEQWLDDLLPANAVELCQDRIELVVTTLPGMQQVGYKRFHDRQDLINIAMASAHVPILLNWKLYRKVRGARVLDGSLPDFFTGQNCDLLECGGDCVIFDYFDDPNLRRRGRLDMLELKQYSEIQRIMGLGYRYAQNLHELRVFDGFHNPYHLPHNHRSSFDPSEPALRGATAAAAGAAAGARFVKDSV